MPTLQDLFEHPDRFFTEPAPTGIGTGLYQSLRQHAGFLPESVHTLAEQNQEEETRRRTEVNRNYALSFIRQYERDTYEEPRQGAQVRPDRTANFLEAFRERFPDLDPTEAQREFSRAATEHDRAFQSARIRNQAAERAQTESGGEWFSRHGVPLASTVRNLVSGVEYGRARQRIRDGKEREGDQRIVADYEARQAEDMKSPIQTVTAGVPAAIGEMIVGGAAVRTIGQAAAPIAASGPRMVAAPIRYLGAGVAESAPLMTARGLAQRGVSNIGQTATMPSMWAPGWVDNNLQANRDPLDPRGLPSAFAMGYLNVAVLGSFGRAGNAITATGVKGQAARLLTRTAIGMMEQDGINTMAEAVSEVLPVGYKLKTGYGLVGHMLHGVHTGDFDPVLSHAVGQALTFAAFSVMHEVQTPRQAVKPIEESLNESHRMGLPQAEAGRRLLEQLPSPGPFEQRGREARPAIAERTPTQPAQDAMPEGMPRGPAFGEGVRPADPISAEARPEMIQPMVRSEPTLTPEPQVRPQVPERQRKAELAQLAKEQEADMARQLSGANEPRPRTYGEAGLEPEVRRMIEESSLTKQQKESLALMLSGASTREAGESLGISHEAARKRASRAFDSLKKKNPSFLPEADTIGDYLTEVQIRAAERLMEAGRGVGDADLQNVGSRSRQAEGSRETVLDTVAMMEAENALYRKEIEDGKKHLAEVGRQTGRTREEVSRAVEEALAESLKVAEAQRGPERVERAEVAQPEGVSSTTRASELKPTEPGSIRAYFEKMEADASARLNEKLGSRFFSGFDPTLIPDLIKLVTAKIVNRGFAFADWIKDVQRLSSQDRLKGLEEHADAIWDEAAKAAREATGDKSLGVEKSGKSSGKTFGDRIADIIAAAPAPSAEQRTFSQATGEPMRETALANAKMDAERKARGAPEVLGPARQANQAVWDRAMERVARDPLAGEGLVDQLTRNPRATTVEENAVLLRHKVALQNEHEKSMLDYVRLFREKAPPEKLIEAETRESMLMSQLDQLDNVTRSTGTEWGRAGQFRRQLAAEDFSLSGMMFRARKAKGAELTNQEAAKVAELNKKIAELNQRIGQLEADIFNNKAINERNRTMLGENPNKELTKARFEYADHVKLYKEFVKSKEFQKKSVAEKTWSWIGEGANLIRAVRLGFDLPPLFRQGLLYTLGHPVESVKAFGKTAKSFMSREKAFEIESSLMESPSMKDGSAQRAGLELTSTEGALGQHEEAFRSSLVKHIPVLAGLERWHSAFMNQVRVKYFETMRESLGRDHTDAELKIIASAANVLTGRGNLGKFEPAVGLLSHIFTSPKWTWSRFQTLLGQPLWHGNMQTRKAVAKEYVKSAIGLSALLGAAYFAKLGGMDIETELDPRSADFGKIRVGNTRLDPYGGIQQGLVFLTRLLFGKSKTSTGQVVDIRGANLPFGRDDAWDVAMRFARGRLAPIPAAIVDERTGRDLVGRPVTPQQAAFNLVTPLVMDDVWEAFKDLGFPKGLAVSIWAILGGGTQSHSRASRR